MLNLIRDNLKSKIKNKLGIADTLIIWVYKYSYYN